MEYEYSHNGQTYRVVDADDKHRRNLTVTAHSGLWADVTISQGIYYLRVYNRPYGFDRLTAEGAMDVSRATSSDVVRRACELIEETAAHLLSTADTHPPRNTAEWNIRNFYPII